MTSPPMRARCGSWASWRSLIAGLPNPVERDIYISRWAGELGVSAEAFRQQVQSQWRKKRTAEQKKQQTADLRPAPQEVEINRKDPQRARNMSAALAEDKLIAALLKNNDFYGFIRERIGPGRTFVTDSNARYLPSCAAGWRRTVRCPSPPFPRYWTRR